MHLGIAVDLDFQGLVVPVVHDADGLRLRALAAAIRDVAARARAKQLGPDDLAGGTFTITNPGAARHVDLVPDHQRPAGRHPLDRRRLEAGRRRRPTAACASRRSATCASRFDHRALDGAYAGAFLHRVREIIERRDWRAEI